jgi:hypothetical protein
LERKRFGFFHQFQKPQIFFGRLAPVRGFEIRLVKCLILLFQVEYFTHWQEHSPMFFRVGLFVIHSPLDGLPVQEQFPCLVKNSATLPGGGAKEIPYIPFA